MAHILKNKNLEIHIDLPLENYDFSRFDWTGKISQVKFQNMQVSGVERTDAHNENDFGKGFYNEFGIDSALGFEEAEKGEWFHKIGIGLLKKDGPEYLFHKTYQIRPARFEWTAEPHRIALSCTSDSVNGYSYELKKVISLDGNSFAIKYKLKNTGEKSIQTDEYVHNFTAINKDPIGNMYRLRFPFQLNPDTFGEVVNTEQKVEMGRREITIKDTPNEQFFFSNLSGGKYVDAQWDLLNVRSRIGLRETGNFETNKVNLWGWKHVISPELFFSINIEPGESAQWSRKYEVYAINV